MTYQIFRTLLFHFGTDNYVPITGTAPKYGIALFVKNLLSRKNTTQDDLEADERFYNSLVQNLKRFAKGDGERIYEEQFCELMRTFNTEHPYEFSDEDQYD